MECSCFFWTDKIYIYVFAFQNIVFKYIEPKKSLMHCQAPQFLIRLPSLV